MADISQSPPEMKPNYTFIIKGIVRNARTKAPLRREINFYENNTNFATEWSKAGTGELMIIIKKKLGDFEATFGGDSNFKSFKKTFQPNPSKNVIEITIDLEPIDKSTNLTTTNAPPQQQKDTEFLRKQEEERKRREEEKRKKDQEVRKKREEEKSRNIEAACRM